jgi:hypothetical protein
MASWIVRNWLGSNDVAILDIHVIRAGKRMGLFSTIGRVEQHYLKMERRVLDLAVAMIVPATTDRPLKPRSHHLSKQSQLQQAQRASERLMPVSSGFRRIWRSRSRVNSPLRSQIPRQRPK